MGGCRAFRRCDLSHAGSVAANAWTRKARADGSSLRTRVGCALILAKARKSAVWLPPESSFSDEHGDLERMPVVLRRSASRRPGVLICGSDYTSNAQDRAIACRSSRDLRHSTGIRSAGSGNSSAALALQRRMPTLLDGTQGPPPPGPKPRRRPLLLPWGRRRPCLSPMRTTTPSSDALGKGIVLANSMLISARRCLAPSLTASPGPARSRASGAGPWGPGRRGIASPG